MPPKAEYWLLSERKVRKLQEQVLVQGQLVWDQLKPYGFTNWHTSDGWIGCWMDRRSATASATVGIRLEQEEPLRFCIHLKLTNDNKAEEEVFTRSFDSIASLNAVLPTIMKDLLEHIA